MNPIDALWRAWGVMAATFCVAIGLGFVIGLVCDTDASSKG